MRVHVYISAMHKIYVDIAQSLDQWFCDQGGGEGREAVEASLYKRQSTLKGDRIDYHVTFVAVFFVILCGNKYLFLASIWHKRDLEKSFSVSSVCSI